MADQQASVANANSAAVYRYAVELIEDTRRVNSARLDDARELAALVRIADETAAERILSAAEEACGRDLLIAQQQADEVIRHARAGIMAAVRRYAEALIEDARQAGEDRTAKARDLADLVRLADSASAEKLMSAIDTVNNAAQKTAERQARGVLETTMERLSGPSEVAQNPSDAQPGRGPAPADSIPSSENDSRPPTEFLRFPATSPPYVPPTANNGPADDAQRRESGDVYRPQVTTSEPE